MPIKISSLHGVSSTGHSPETANVCGNSLLSRWVACKNCTASSCGSQMLVVSAQVAFGWSSSFNPERFANRQSHHDPWSFGYRLNRRETRQTRFHAGTHVASLSVLPVRIWHVLQSTRLVRWFHPATPSRHPVCFPAVPTECCERWSDIGLRNRQRLFRRSSNRQREDVVSPETA